uniref:hypothetical protein n=1 Tax=Stappia sp. TaxID=1870903 RepID=UPI003BA9C2C0
MAQDVRTTSPSRSRPDQLTARIAAFALALGGLALMGWIGFFGFAGVALTPFANIVAGSEATASGNPALEACLAERVGAVDSMRRDGVVSDAQYDTFRARAVSYCRAENPPPL